MTLRIIAYRNQLLPISETFIYNQTMRLSRYETFLLGAKRPTGSTLELPSERLYLINDGGKRGWLREFGFKVLGWIPPDVLSWAQDKKPVLMHAHFGPDGLLALPVAEALRVPLIVTFHGHDATLLHTKMASNFTSKKYVWLRRKLVRKAKILIAVSEFTKNLVVQQGFPEDRIEVLHYGVDLKLFQKPARFDESPNVLFVGRLVPKKGCDVLIQAMHTVVQKMPHVKLTIIGDGPERQRLEQMAHQLIESGSCVFAGAQFHDVVREYMTKAWVLSVPSLTDVTGDSEGFPNVILEAMASCVPVVGTQHAGIPEAIIDGQTGFLVAENDIAGLAKKILVLLGNRKLCIDLGLAGRKRAEQHFDLDRQNQKLEKIYDKVLHT